MESHVSFKTIKCDGVPQDGVRNEPGGHPYVPAGQLNAADEALVSNTRTQVDNSQINRNLFPAVFSGNIQPSSTNTQKLREMMKKQTNKPTFYCTQTPDLYILPFHPTTLQPGVSLSAGLRLTLARGGER